MFGSLVAVAPGTAVGDFDFVVAGVPWPASLVMLGAAIMALGLSGLLTPARGPGDRIDDP